tara:strand:- start:13836 stop:16079 length:2244 start_codon:yes stop_codon:yes gene_type:complete
MSKISLIITSFLFGLFSTFPLSGQNVDLVLKVADNLFENKEYYGSIGFYEKALEIDSSNAKVLYGYARNLTELNQHEQSIRYYQKAALYDQNGEFPLAEFYLAEAYRTSEDYRKARRYYTRAIRPYNRDRKSYWYQRIKQNSDANKWAAIKSSEQTANPNNLSSKVNSSFSEFSPVIHDGKLYFSAMIADSLAENNRINDKQFLSRIYVKSLSDAKKAKQVAIHPEVEREIASMHLANPSFDGNSIYFSVCDSTFSCEIWKGKINNDVIDAVSKLNKNINYPNSNNTQGHYFKNNDGGYLIFTSNRSGGFGGLDLWIAKEESFGFDKAKNLGTTINSLGDEISPFYDVATETLLFSSDWHYGFGGFDVFMAKGKPGFFEEHSNLGMGVNSGRDDYYFFHKDGMAVFSSNRIKGNTDAFQGCCNDLFETKFDLGEPIFVEPEVSVATLNKLLPLSLYFHNDEPNPNSQSATTNKNYKNLALDFLEMKETYITKLSKRLSKDELLELEDFFDLEIESGLIELEEFTPKLLEELEKGNQIELSIKGFASALSKSDYNLKLTNRRIESLLNYFKSYKNGVFIPYLEGTAQNQGKLAFNKLPFGDYATNKNSTQVDELLAVYGLESSRQRKIELVAVSSKLDDTELNIDALAALVVSKNKIEAGKITKGETLEVSIPISNSGDGELNIYNVKGDCNCFEADFEKTVAPNSQSSITLKIDTKGFSAGNQSITVLIVSNSKENLIELTIDFILN